MRRHLKDLPGEQFASSAQDGRVCLWDAETGATQVPRLGDRHCVLAPLPVVHKFKHAKCCVQLDDVLKLTNQTC